MEQASGVFFVCQCESRWCVSMLRLRKIFTVYFISKQTITNTQISLIVLCINLLVSSSLHTDIMFSSATIFNLYSGVEVSGDVCHDLSFIDIPTFLPEPRVKNVF